MAVAIIPVRLLPVMLNTEHRAVVGDGPQRPAGLSVTTVTGGWTKDKGLAGIAYSERSDPRGLGNTVPSAPAGLSRQ